MVHKIIAIDLDDTLSATTKGVVAYASKVLGVPMQLGDITSSAYWGSYGVDDSRAIEIVHGYNLEGFPGLEPIGGAIDAIRRLAPAYELHVITSRDVVSRQPTIRWIEKHFPKAFREIIFVGNKYVSESVRTKASLCLDLGADLLIDDSLYHLSECLHNGTATLLFGDYQWTPAKLPAGVIPVKTWQAVEAYLHVEGR